MSETDHVHEFGTGTDPCPCGADILAVASGAWAGGGEPRAQTAAELRDRFMDTVRANVDYWASAQVQRDTVQERLSGLAHSLLCMIDGSNMGLPAFDLAASPHPDDKAYHQIVYWFEVEEGDLVAFDGRMRQLVQMWPTLLPAPYDLGVRLLHGGMTEDFNLDSNSVVAVRRYDLSEEQR